MKVLASLLANEFKGVVDGTQNLKQNQFQELLGGQSQPDLVISDDLNNEQWQMGGGAQRRIDNSQMLYPPQLSLVISDDLNNEQWQMGEQASNWLMQAQSRIDNSQMLHPPQSGLVISGDSLSQVNLNNEQWQTGEQSSNWLVQAQNRIDDSQLLYPQELESDLNFFIPASNEKAVVKLNYNQLLPIEQNETASYSVSGFVESSSKSVESGDAKPMQQRLLPLGSLGNGYLSIISHTAQLSNRPINDAPPNSVEQIQSHAVVSKSDIPLDAEQETLSTLISEVVNNAAVAHASQKQFSNSTERVWAHIELNPAHSEIAKRFFMQTPGNEGNTFWYRDYEMSELDKQTLATRLMNSEFANANQIERLVINGSLIWNVFDGNLDNVEGRF